MRVQGRDPGIGAASRQRIGAASRQRIGVRPPVPREPRALNEILARNTRPRRPDQDGPHRATSADKERGRQCRVSPAVWLADSHQARLLRRSNRGALGKRPWQGRCRHASASSTPPYVTPRTSCTSHCGARSMVPGRLVSPAGATSFRGARMMTSSPAEGPPAETDGGGGTYPRASPAYWLAELGGRGSLGVGQQRRSPEGGNPERATLEIGCPQTWDAFGTTPREVNRSRLPSVASFDNTWRGKTEWPPTMREGRPLGRPFAAPAARHVLPPFEPWRSTASGLAVGPEAAAQCGDPAGASEAGILH